MENHLIRQLACRGRKAENPVFANIRARHGENKQITDTIIRVLDALHLSRFVRISF